MTTPTPPDPRHPPPGVHPTQAVAPEDITAAPDPAAPGHADAQPSVGVSQREYGHSSEDRNTRDRESQWPGFEGGTQDVASTDAPRPRPGRPRDP